MKTMTALIRREFLEHRGAFLYAPAVLLGLMTVLISAGLIFGHTPRVWAHTENMSALTLMQIAFAAISAMWSVYLIIMLYFYYADAFSADGRNNSMLFWKSMPVTDLRILTAKALSGITILPTLILGFALITMILTWLLSFPLSAKLPVFPVANPIDMLITLFSTGVVLTINFLLTILWYAPFLALVAGLSVLVKRWAIPAALLLIGALIVSEGVLTIGNEDKFHPIRDYLAYRAQGPAEGIDPRQFLLEGGYLVPFRLIGEIIMRIDWVQMGIGVLFAILVVYLVSEYRRHRLDG